MSIRDWVLDMLLVFCQAFFSNLDRSVGGCLHFISVAKHVNGRENLYITELTIKISKVNKQRVLLLFVTCLIDYLSLSMVLLRIKIKKQLSKNSSGCLNAKWRAFWALLHTWSLQLDIVIFFIQSDSSDCLHEISCALCLLFHGDLKSSALVGI